MLLKKFLASPTVRECDLISPHYFDFMDLDFDVVETIRKGAHTFVPTERVKNQDILTARNVQDFVQKVTKVEVPSDQYKILWSDGNKTFATLETENFLKRWKIKIKGK